MFNISRSFVSHSSPKLSNDLRKLNEKLTELEGSGIVSFIRKIFSSKSYRVGHINIFSEFLESSANRTTAPKSKSFFSVQGLKNSYIFEKLGSLFSGFDKLVKHKTNFFQYGGIAPKEFRNLAKTELYKNSFPENSKAGRNLTIVGSLEEKNAVARSIMNLFNFTKISLVPSGNNIFSHLLRENILHFSDALSSIFKENDLAKAIKLARCSNPSFSIELFMKNCREYLIPEFIEGFLREDISSIKNIVSESLFDSLISSQLKPERFLDNCSGKLLDIRNVELVASRIVEHSNNPIFIISCSCNQVSKRNTKPEFISYILAIEIRQSHPKIVEFTMHNRGW